MCLSSQSLLLPFYTTTWELYSRHSRGTSRFVTNSRSIVAIQALPTVWERCSTTNGIGLQCRPQQIVRIWQTLEEQPYQENRVRRQRYLRCIVATKANLSPASNATEKESFNCCIYLKK